MTVRFGEEFLTHKRRGTQGFRTTNTPPPPPVTDLGGYRPQMPNAHGMQNKGGRGTWPNSGPAPIVIAIDTLNPETPLGAGTVVNGMTIRRGGLRAALTYNGPRFVVFERSGIISYNQNIKIYSPFLTVAGQTAPSPGVTIRVTPNGMAAYENSILIHTNNTVWQHIRVRPGANAFTDAFQVWNEDNAANDTSMNLFDHCSISWFLDDGITFNYHYPNQTIWRCILAEGFHPSRQAGAPGTDDGHCIGFGKGATNTSAIQNITANCFYRQPFFGEGTSAFWANNLSYGFRLAAWLNDFNETSVRGKSQFRGNHYRRDGSPYTAGDILAFRSSMNDTGVELYLDDNLIDNSGVANNITPYRDDGTFNPLVTTPPASIFPAGYTVMPSSQVYNHVTSVAGCRPKFRNGVDNDGVDTRILNNITNRTGVLIDDEADVGGFPPLAQNSNTFQMPANPLAVGDAVGRLNIEIYLEQLAQAVEP